MGVSCACMQVNSLRAILSRSEIKQSELAEGIGKSVALVSRIISGDIDPSKETIDAILAFLQARTRRHVTYEQVFGARPEPIEKGA